MSQMDNNSLTLQIDALQHTPMRDFLRDKTVFITGSTGVLGELFVEKLLRYVKIRILSIK